MKLMLEREVDRMKLRTKEGENAFRFMREKIGEIAGGPMGLSVSPMDTFDMWERTIRLACQVDAQYLAVDYAIPSVTVGDTGSLQ